MPRFLTALIAVLAALVWLQTRYIWRFGSLGGELSEYGTIGVFATELVALEVAVLAIAAVMRPRNRHLLKTPIVLAAFGAVLAPLFALIPAGGTPYAFILAGRAVLGFGLFLAIFLWKPPRTLLLRSLVGAAAANAVLGFTQFSTQRVAATTWFGIASHLPADLGAFVVETANGRWLRAYGALPHPNVYGVLLAVGIVAALGFACAAETRGRRALLLGLAAALSSALLLSFSRTAFVALAVGLTVMLASLAKTAGPQRRTAIVGTAFVAAALAVTGLIASEPSLARFTGSGRLETRSLEERSRGIGDAFILIITHPMTGVGIGEMPAAVLRELGPREPYDAQPAHNEPLLAWAETGTLGFFGWLTFRWKLYREAKKRQTAARENRERVFSAVSAAILALILVVSLFEHFLWDSWSGVLLFWLAAGLITLPPSEAKKSAP